MKKNNNFLEVPNINARDAQVKKIIYKVEDNLFDNCYELSSKSEYLCICSGGTTSNSARNGLILIKKGI